MNYFIFGKINPQDYHMCAVDKNQFEGGGKVIETIKIPGRTGTLSIEDGSFENIPITYKVICKGNVRENIKAFRNKLSATSGYCRLSDTFDPDVFMNARYVDKFTVDASDRKNAAFTVNFDCDPRKFLVRGEKPISITSGFRIKNPALHDANPLIDVVGSGTISINSVSVIVSGVSGETIIDCDTQEAYYGTVSRNSNITLDNGEFPKLTPGENTITYSGFASVKITPRWWTI